MNKEQIIERLNLNCVVLQTNLWALGKKKIRTSTYNSYFGMEHNNRLIGSIWTNQNIIRIHIL